MSIEVFSTHDGLMIPSIGRVSLCSKVSPLKEAKDWVTHFRKDLLWTDEVFVVGLGAGFHLIQLCHEFPKKNVFVFEPESEVIEFFFDSFECPENLKVILTSDRHQFEPYTQFRNKRFIILPFRPAFSPNPPRYTSVLRALLKSESTKVDLKFIQRLLEEGAYRCTGSLGEREKIHLLMKELIK